MFLKTLLASLVLGSGSLATQACTLWAAAGAEVGSGTLISKNRDWKPDHFQYLKKVMPKTGWAYFGLYAKGNDDPGLKAGVNEKGLSIVSASSNIPRKVRDQQLDVRGIMVRTLTDYQSVDEVIAHAEEIFSRSRANFFLISDRSKVLTVEVGLEGKYSYKVDVTGVATHTNHYLDPVLAELYNKKIGASSATRYERINTLLGQSSAPYSLENFAALSRDQHDGPDNSLWRTGREHTMASWIVATPAAGPPHLRVLIANPGEAEVVHDLLLDEAFWRN